MPWGPNGWSKWEVNAYTANMDVALEVSVTEGEQRWGRGWWDLRFPADYLKGLRTQVKPGRV